MATTTPKRISAKQAAIDVLKRANGPMKLEEIADKAIKKVPHLSGENPKHTIKIQVIQGHLKGRIFTRVDRGMYGLRDDWQEQVKAGGRKKAEPAETTDEADVDLKKAAAAADEKARKAAQAEEKKGKAAATA